MNLIKPKAWRKGQTLFNFLEWLQIVKNVDSNQNSRMADPFHLDDKTLDTYYDEFLQSLAVSTKKRKVST